MKNTFKTLITLSLLVFWAAPGSFAQDYEFKILATKGSNKISGQKVLVGSEVLASDDIIIAEGGYIGLAHKSGTPWESMTPGTYKASEISKNIAANASKQGNQYVRFVTDELSGKSGDRSRFGKVKTGSVTRSLLYPIGLVLPNKTEVYPDKPMAITWTLQEGSEIVKGLKPSGKYRVRITNLYEEVVFEQTTSETHMIIDASKLFADDSPALLLKIEDAQNPKLRCDDKKFSFVSVSTDPVKQKEVERFFEENNYSEMPLDLLIMAQFFEVQGLWPNANAAYLKAMQITDMESIKQQYEEFQIRSQKHLDKLMQEQSEKLSIDK